jgi:phosphohistidine phosphatase
MKLYCVRHCEALAPDVDPERGLSEQGRSDAQKLAEHIKQQKIIIPCVMHSGIKRAHETADYIAEACMSEEIVADPQLLDDQADVLVVAEKVKYWTRDTVLVGHMPYMSNLVSVLLMDSESGVNPHLLTYAPGTMVCLAQVADGRWVIDWIIKPENLS